MFGGFVLLLLLAAWSQRAAASSSSLLERYALTDCRYGERSAVTTATVPSLMGYASLLGDLKWEGNNNASTFECDPGLGIRVVTATGDAAADPQTNMGARKSSSIWQSHATIAALQVHYASSSSSTEAFGLTLALWLRPTYLSPPAIAGPLADQIQTILTLDNEERPNNVLSCAPLSLAQWQQYLLLTFQDTNQICRELVVRNHTLEPDTYAHVVVSFNASAVSVFMEGVAVVQGASKIIAYLPTWEESTTLRLFGTGSNVNINQDETGFAGWIQQVEMYDRAFNATDASNLYNEGIFFAQQPDDKIFLLPNNNETGTLPDVQDLEVTIAQDNTDGSEIQLSGVFADVRPFTLAMQVTKLPKHGALLTASRSTILVDEILLANITEVVLHYKLHSSEYFNAPTLNGQGFALVNKKPDSVAYRWVTRHPQTLETVHSSDHRTVLIHVVHVNHPPSTLTVPPTTTKISNGSTTIQVVTGNITVTDPLDFNLDRVRIDVSCSFGQLTLHPAYRALVDFESCRHRSLSNWQCIGTGVKDRTMTFLAIPDGVRFLLRNLKYQAFTPGTADMIQIRLYDGASTSEDELGCLYQSEHEEFSVGRLGNRFTTLHRECWVRKASIQVEAYTTSGGSDRASRTEIVQGFVFLGITMLLVCCCCCGVCLGMIPSCLARGRSVEADTDSFNNNDENKKEEKKEE